MKKKKSRATVPRKPGKSGYWGVTKDRNLFKAQMVVLCNDGKWRPVLLGRYPTAASAGMIYDYVYTTFYPQGTTHNNLSYRIFGRLRELGQIFGEAELEAAVKFLTHEKEINDRVCFVQRGKHD